MPTGDCVMYWCSTTQNDCRATQPTQSCTLDCPCSCHCLTSDIRVIPGYLNPWLGQLNIPRALLSSLWSSWYLGTRERCATCWGHAHHVKGYLPTWFAEVEATFRFPKVFIHLTIQTPRVVPSLHHLLSITSNEFRTKLSTGEVTLRDVQPDGLSVLHVRLRAPEVNPVAHKICSVALP